MGARHARVVAESDDAELAVVLDIDAQRVAEVADQFGAASGSDLADLEHRCDAAVVATPTPMHIESVLPLLERGIPVLIEKPIAETAEDVEHIIETSRRIGAPVMCGFVERFNPALVAAMEIIDAPVVHMRAARHSPRNPGASSTIVQDLLIHDIDLALRAGRRSQGTDDSRHVLGAAGLVPYRDRRVRPPVRRRHGRAASPRPLGSTQDSRGRVRDQRAALRSRPVASQRHRLSQRQPVARERGRGVPRPNRRRRSVRSASRRTAGVAVRRVRRPRPRKDPDRAETERLSILPAHEIAAVVDGL